MTSRVPVACETRKDDLAALALGEPLGEREAALRAHLETCPGCRAYHAAMARTLGAVRALPRPEPSAELTERILEAARQSHRSALVRSTGIVARWLELLAAAFRRPLLASAVVAVAVASAAVALLVLGREDAPAPTSGTSEPQLARFEAPAAEPAQPTVARPPAAPSAVPDKSLEAGSTRARDPAPAAPETVALVLPAETPLEQDILVEEPPQREEQERLRAEEGELEAPGPEGGAGRTGGTADSRSTRVPSAAPSPAEPAGAAAAGARFSPGREVGASGGEVVVGGQQPAAGPDEAARDEFVDNRVTSETEPAATGSTTVPTLTGTLRLDSDDGFATTRATAGGASVSAAQPSPPPPPVMPTTTPSPAQAPEPPAYADSAGAGTDSVAYFAAPPADLPAADQSTGYGGLLAEDVEAAEESYPSTRDAEQAGDRVSLARRQLADGDAAQAEALLEQALREETARAADVTFLLAETYARQGKWSDAARTYELFLARHLDDPRANEARWRAADAYRRTGNETRSAALLRQLVGVPGYDDRARTALAGLSGGSPAAAGAAAVDTTTGEAVSAPVMAEPAEAP
ncbi:MAG: tetratricopeptide repeat protein [Deltaproteobacteria bacterium]|nr:tetratricopeptide repeat protein [Deltaproteobacteria bacterium]